jgi:hypothetical protein
VFGSSVSRFRGTGSRIGSIVYLRCGFPISTGLPLFATGRVGRIARLPVSGKAVCASVGGRRTRPLPGCPY